MKKFKLFSGIPSVFWGIKNICYICVNFFGTDSRYPSPYPKKLTDYIFV